MVCCSGRRTFSTRYSSTMRSQMPASRPSSSAKSSVGVQAVVATQSEINAQLLFTEHATAHLISGGSRLKCKATLGCDNLRPVKAESLVQSPKLKLPSISANRSIAGIMPSASASNSFWLPRIVVIKAHRVIERLAIQMTDRKREWNHFQHRSMLSHGILHRRSVYHAATESLGLDRNQR